MHLVVYNTLSTKTRETHIKPSKGWGGEGILGCKLSMGDEFSIPCPASMKGEKPKSKILSMFTNLKISKSKLF